VINVKNTSVYELCLRTTFVISNSAKTVKKSDNTYLVIIFLYDFHSLFAKCRFHDNIP